MAPDRTQLQNMFKKEDETFKEYAQRWRDLAAQVAPPMVKREMITMMVDTFPVFYYEKLVGYKPSSFADLVFTGERIEVGLKRGKFDYVSSITTHVVTSAPAWVKPLQTSHGTHRNSSNSAPVQPKAPAPIQREAPQAPAPTTARPTGNSNAMRNFPQSQFQNSPHFQ